MQDEWETLFVTTLYCGQEIGILNRGSLLLTHNYLMVYRKKILNWTTPLRNINKQPIRNYYDIVALKESN